eukprot:5352381-Prymnesium_polylepis.1
MRCPRHRSRQARRPPYRHCRIRRRRAAERRTTTLGMFILVLGSTAGLGNFLSSLFAVERTVFDYGKLKGLPESFAFEAGQQALKGEVAATSSDGLAIATFAGGCFWGTELQYMRMRGVVATCVGYTQGTLEQPTYSEVCSGTTGHTEACQIVYDPKRCPYELLCAKLFETIDPTVLNRVGNDVGTQYRHGIYPVSAARQPRCGWRLMEALADIWPARLCSTPPD